MKLWLISQDVNTGYDTYDSAVVAAETEEQARLIHPSQYADAGWGELNGQMCWRGTYNCPHNSLKHGKLYDASGYDWTDPANVAVRLIGDAAEGSKPGIICASFNAG
jgi:hypothetical protein